MKTYVFAYKLFGIAAWYEFTCSAASLENARSAFISENRFGIERYYVSGSYDIK